MQAVNRSEGDGYTALLKIHLTWALKVHQIWAGSGEGQRRPLAHPEHLAPLGEAPGLEGGISGKEELSSMQETKLGNLSFTRDSNSSRVNGEDAAKGCAC